MAAAKPPNPQRRFRGFEPASTLLRERIRAAGEKRGFAVTRLLTGWAEIVGADLARMTRPVKVGYAREGFGATLTILVQSAHAPMVQMQVPMMIQRVNACYGHAAISRIVLTQTAPSGFADGQADFGREPAPTPPPDPAIRASAQEIARDVRDEGLRAALENITQNFMVRARSRSKG